MPIKSVKMKIMKNKKMRLFLISQGSLNQKIMFLCQEVCSVAQLRTDRHTWVESEYRGHPFRDSGIFPSTYHQGSVQTPQCAISRRQIIWVVNQPFYPGKLLRPHRLLPGFLQLLIVHIQVRRGHLPGAPGTSCLYPHGLIIRGQTSVVGVHDSPTLHLWGIYFKKSVIKIIDKNKLLD